MACAECVEVRELGVSFLLLLAFSDLPVSTPISADAGVSRRRVASSLRVA
jgi:hypothetical protein